MRFAPLLSVLSTCCLLLAVGPALADAPTKTLSPYFFIEGGDEGQEQFPLKSTDVETVINGVIADVKVRQRYANTGSQPINARYVFPASTRAAVHGMQMTVGEDVVTAKIKERQKAKKEFSEAKAAGQSASLLEQQRPNVFTMEVANIMPGDEVSVELHYSELLIPENGQYGFVYPTVVGPRYSTIQKEGADDHHQWLSNPYLKANRPPTSEFSMAVTLAAGLPIQKVACKTHATKVDWEGKTQALIKLTDKETHGGNRDFILNYRLSGDQIHSGMMVYQGDHENFFMLMVQPPERIKLETIPAREYIFVVDVSGSMNGFPLNTAKTLLKELIGSLRPTDTFNVILFSGAAKVLAPRSLPANSANIQSAIQHIDRQQGGGGTELYRAVKTGLDLPRSEGQSRTMIVVTDGYIAAEQEVFGLISDNLNKSNVFAFGIGRSVNRYLIEGLAKTGQGEPFVVTAPDAAASIAKRFKTYIEAPLLAGITIDFDKFDAYDVEPKVTADLFAQRPLVICGKWRGKLDGKVAIKGFTGTGPYDRSIAISPDLSSKNSRALPYLWARTRLSRLSDFTSDNEADETRKEVTRLGLDYNLLTRHTSFVAVHEKVRNPETPAKDVVQPLPMPLGVSNLAVGSRNVPEPELGIFLAAAAFASLWWLRRLRREIP